MSESDEERQNITTVVWDEAGGHVVQEMYKAEDKYDKASKKRVRNPSQWKRVRQKKARISGKEYVNVRGNFVPARAIGDDCKCKLMCYKHVDEKMRNMIFEGFYDLQSYDEQNAYLFGLIRKHDIKRKTNPMSARRTCTYKYYLRFRGREINVCKVAFARIHAISAKKIRGLCEKLDQNILFPKDGRGKHTNRPQKIQPETQELIKRHLFSVLSSSDVREYFKEDKNHPASTELNITKLYKHFLMTYEPEGLIPGTMNMNPGHIPRVKMWLYRNVFHREFKTKEYQVLKKKVEQGYRQSSSIEDSSLSDKVFMGKKAKRKGSKPQKKQIAVATVIEHADPVQTEQHNTGIGVGVQTVVQRVPKPEGTVITFPMDVNFGAFSNQGNQIIANRTIDPLSVEQRASATMVQINRGQTINPTLGIQKINYTIQDAQGNQHLAPQNYQIFHADAYHQNILTGADPIYHVDKSGEIIPLRPVRIATGCDMNNLQLSAGYKLEY